MQIANNQHAMLIKKETMQTGVCIDLLRCNDVLSVLALHIAWGVVIADGEPGEHAGKDRVGSRASLHGTSNLKRVLPYNLGEMKEVSAPRWVCLAVKTRVH